MDRIQTGADLVQLLLRVSQTVPVIPDLFAEVGKPVGDLLQLFAQGQDILVVPSGNGKLAQGVGDQSLRAVCAASSSPSRHRAAPERLSISFSPFIRTFCRA